MSKEELGDKKDIEIFANSKGGKKVIAELRRKIALDVYKFSTVDNTEALEKLLIKLKANVSFYRMLVTAEDEVEALEKALKDESEEDD